MSTAPFVLVPGHWLGGWSWDRVTPGLVAAGHRVTAVTLPGLESAESDRSRVRLADHIAALADIVAREGRDTVLVAHSGAGKVVTGVLDQDPDSVARVVYVDSGPSSPGDATELPPELVELVLPPFDQLQASLDGLTPSDLQEFRDRSRPHPAGPVRDPLTVGDPRRRTIPSTIVSCSFPSSTVAELAAAGHPMFAEVARLDDLRYVDLPTGHWPMWSRPRDLAEALLAAVG
ncbi:MAG: alpha/beta fold hydrolase [Friedmanniella sp.]